MGRDEPRSAARLDEPTASARDHRVVVAVDVGTLHGLAHGIEAAMIALMVQARIGAGFTGAVANPLAGDASSGNVVAVSQA